MASNILSAANMALFIALCVLLNLGTFMNPGEQPTKQPPGKVNFGIDYIHYDRIILSNRGEKGICFFVGIEGLAVTTSPSRVCIPFEECTSLLKEEFQKRF